MKHIMMIYYIILIQKKLNKLREIINIIYQKSYYYNINGNKDIFILNNINNTINNESYIRLTGTTTNNIYYNNTYNSNFTCNMNKLSNLIVYNTFDKYINNNSNEIYKKSKYNHLLLKVSSIIRS